MTKSCIPAAIAMLALASMPAIAADAADCKMEGMTMDMKPKGDGGPVSLAYAHANMVMHSNMNFTYSGDADVDFVKGMMPHHQGAIDMANIVLRSGKDPEIRKLAEAVVKAQESEIAQMQAWLKAHAQ